MEGKVDIGRAKRAGGGLARRCAGFCGAGMRQGRDWNGARAGRGGGQWLAGALAATGWHPLPLRLVAGQRTSGRTQNGVITATGHTGDGHAQNGIQRVDMREWTDRAWMVLASGPRKQQTGSRRLAAARLRRATAGRVTRAKRETAGRREGKCNGSGQS